MRELSERQEVRMSSRMIFSFRFRSARHAQFSRSSKIDPFDCLLWTKSDASAATGVSVYPADNNQNKYSLKPMFSSVCIVADLLIMRKSVMEALISHSIV